MKKLSFLILWGLLLSTSATLFAQANLSVQGTIQRSFGAAVDDGSYSLTFRLYENDAAVTPIWEETMSDVEVIGGVYSVVLGSSEPLDVPFDKPYYLGVSVDGGTELTPRAQLTSSPYALSLIGQNNIFPSTGPVGVGTTQPESQQALHVVGNTKLQGNMQVTSNVQIQGNLEITGTVTGIDTDVDFTNIDSDVNTTGDINADGDITANNGKPVPVAEEELRIIRGTVNADAIIVAGGGFGVSFDSNSGVYKVTFNSAFSSPPVVTASGPSVQAIPSVRAVGSNTFEVLNFIPGLGGFGYPVPFSFIAVGPR